jgi:hypothetical protein
VNPYITEGLNFDSYHDGSLRAESKNESYAIRETRGEFQVSVVRRLGRAKTRPLTLGVAYSLPEAIGLAQNSARISAAL